MGYYTDYEFVKGRFGFEFLCSILEDQIPYPYYPGDDAHESEIDTILDAYVEAEIAKIDALIDSACIKQITVPVATTNASFGILEGIAEALILRKVASHTQHDDIPSKLENEYVSAMRMLWQIMRSDMTLAQDGQTGPNAEGDSIAVSEPDETVFHIDMEDAW